MNNHQEQDGVLSALEAILVEAENMAMTTHCRRIFDAGKAAVAKARTPEAGDTRRSDGLVDQLSALTIAKFDARKEVGYFLPLALHADLVAALTAKPVDAPAGVVERIKIAVWASLTNANGGMEYLDHDSMDEMIEAAWTGFEPPVLAVLRTQSTPSEPAQAQPSHWGFRAKKNGDPSHDAVMEDLARRIDDE